MSTETSDRVQVSPAQNRVIAIGVEPSAPGGARPLATPDLPGDHRPPNRGRRAAANLRSRCEAVPGQLHSTAGSRAPCESEGGTDGPSPGPRSSGPMALTRWGFSSEVWTMFSPRSWLPRQSRADTSERGQAIPSRFSKNAAEQPLCRNRGLVAVPPSPVPIDPPRSECCRSRFNACIM